MGTAASTVREELQKPLDGSDLETLSDARSEVARLRSELHRSEAAETNAGAGAAAAAPAEKAAQTHSSLIMRLYAERGARSGSAVDFETLRVQGVRPAVPLERGEQEHRRFLKCLYERRPRGYIRAEV